MAERGSTWTKGRVGSMYGGTDEPSWGSMRPPTPPMEDGIQPYGYAQHAPSAITLPNLSPQHQHSPNSLSSVSPQSPHQRTAGALPHVSVGSPRSLGTDSYSMGGMNMTDRSIMSQVELEEKRKRALREREREAVAKQRHRELMEAKRAAQLKHKFEEDRVRAEREMMNLTKQQEEADEQQRRRMEALHQKEEEERVAEEERRRRAKVESKREASLRLLEMQRLQTEELQRAHREAILKKRKEMERLRDEAERLYNERKREEAERKVQFVQEVKGRREQRLIEMERRRLDPVVLQQEREFSQLIEVQASIGRMQMKLEQSMASREDVRERLLEARHMVELLEAEELQMGIGVEEVEVDLKKLLGFEKALSMLVTTRYDYEEYDVAIKKLQLWWRGCMSKSATNILKAARKAAREEGAAQRLQSWWRGCYWRGRMQRDEKLVKTTIKVQAMARGRMDRAKARKIKEAMIRATVRIQQAARLFLQSRRAQKEVARVRGLAAVSERSPPRGKGGAAARGGGGAMASPRRQAEGRPAKRRAQPSFQAAAGPSSHANALANGELGRIYGLQANGPRQKGNAGGALSPRARRFVPVAATAAVASKADQDGTLAFFPEMPRGVHVEAGEEAPRLSLLELEDQYYNKHLRGHSRMPPREGGKHQNPTTRKSY